MARENWFFGLPIDGTFLPSLPALPPGFRRYDPGDVHVTLAFLGACDEAAAQRALAALDARRGQLPRQPIRVRLAEVTAMGARRHYTALSALLSDGREQTEALIAALRDPLADAANARRDERRPKAHVTLARPSRRATQSERTAGLEWAASLDLRSVTSNIDRVALYRWSEDRRERLFRVVAERAFG
jgi:2'-5' RNA ligase